MMEVEGRSSIKYGNEVEYSKNYVVVSSFMCTPQLHLICNIGIGLSIGNIVLAASSDINVTYFHMVLWSPVALMLTSFLIINC